MKVQVVVVALMLMLAASVQVEACVSGTFWNDGCNYCTCIRGQTVCSKKYCRDVSRNRGKRAEPHRYHLE